MNTWIAKHGVTVAITVAGLIASFAVYGYRIDVVEKKVENLQNQTIQNQILLAEIKKDIEYIRIQVSKIAD